MTNNKEKFPLAAFIFICFFLIYACNKCSSDNKKLEQSFPHNAILDHTEDFKGRTLESDFTYDAEYRDGLKDVLRQTTSGLYIKCYRFENSQRMDIVFYIPSSTDVPNVKYLDRIKVKFICEDGSLRSGNRVVAISRSE